MFLLVLGFIILIVGIVFRSIITVARYARGFILAGLVVMIIGVSLSCFIQIDAGQVGVKKLFGKVQPDVLESGLHFINPLYEVEKMDLYWLSMPERYLSISSSLLFMISCFFSGE